MRFSIIMPSYLDDYKNAAKDREVKFVRAVDSVINQSFKDWQLIIIADGCDKTVNLYKQANGYRMYFPKIKCLKINKQKGNFVGLVRQKGINISDGEYITYLDTDDYFKTDHLQKLNDQLNDKDWVYYNNNISGKIRNIDYYMMTTSSITHKRLLDVTWDGCNGYGQDFNFAYQLYEKYPNHEKIDYPGYVVCHTINGIDE